MWAVLNGDPPRSRSHALPVRRERLATYVCNIGGYKTTVGGMSSRLQTALCDTMACPTNHSVLRVVASARKELDSYVYHLEDRADVLPRSVHEMTARRPRTGPPLGSGRGYTVYQERNSVAWRCRLTIKRYKGKYLGSRPTQDEAHQLGIEALEEISREPV